MKKTTTLSILASCLLAMFSCENDLDVENPNSLTVDQFWQTPEDAQQGVNSIYAMFYKDGTWARWMYFRLDLTSDEGFSKSPWVELADWTRFSYINYDFWEGNNVTWRDNYKAIFRANQVLAYVPDIEFSDEHKKQELLGEAKFMRGFYYYYTALLWENIPIVLNPSTTTELPKQATLEEVHQQIEADLNDAFNALPPQWDDANLGRPTKGAAKAMLAKLYMQQHQWEKAEAALAYLISGEGALYSLVNNFADNFTAANENNSESVFEIQYGDHNLGGTGETQDAAVSTTRSQFFAPRNIGWSDGQARFWLVDAFKQEKTADDKIDERLRYSLYYPDLTADFGDLIYGREWEWDDDECWFRKYQRNDRTTEDYFNPINYRLIRYADILLRYAEVLNELGRTSEAYTYVDQVRERAGMRPLAEAYPSIGNDKQAFLERLKTERVLELVGESVRWEDLKRWGDLDSQAAVDEIAKRDPDFENFEVGKHIRMPIPLSDVNNNPNLDQNPDY
ncbi:RagB/SusD family nutrient uptake outer membrane protein [Sinomicrobium sp.]